MQATFKNVGIGFIIGVVCTTLVAGAIGLSGAREYSGLLRGAEFRLEQANRDIAEANGRSAAIVRDIDSGLTDLKRSISDGTRSLSERIREAAKAVEAMEDRLRVFERSIDSSTNDSSSVRSE